MRKWVSNPLQQRGSKSRSDSDCVFGAVREKKLLSRPWLIGSESLARAVGPDFPTTLQEGQGTLCLPPGAKLRCVPPDGDCFFHSVKTMLLVDMSIEELREIAKYPKGWAG